MIKIQAEIADVTFPVLTVTNELYVIDTTNSQPGSTFLVEKTKENILSLTVLLKTDFKVDFAVGSADDSYFDGTLYTPEGILIPLVFHDNLWHIPIWRPPSIVPPRTSLPSLAPVVKVNNYYRSLDGTSRDKRATKTITAIIAALHDEGHQGPLEQGFIGNRLHGTDVSEFIHARYSSLVKFLQDGTCFDDFVVTFGNKGTCFIDHVPKLVLPKPIRVSPVDSMPLDSDSSVLMCLSLSRWGFPYSARHLQIYHKYKGKVVPFPPDFRTMLPCYRDPTIGVSLGTRGYRTSPCVKRHGSQKQGIPPVAGDAARSSELPQENQDVLKKIREMKLGARIGHAHSMSIGRLGEKYYLMIVIDGIDFLWPQT